MSLEAKVFSEPRISARKAKLSDQDFSQNKVCKVMGSIIVPGQTLHLSSASPFPLLTLNFESKFGQIYSHIFILNIQ